ncbi:MAG: hypothetical protein OXP09_10575, partial [Gammaproteobacteria bacterium]|nr:hypothetical protein [Gammaproteobacteria bacterium]MDE0366002.1 hypothetical protein [Gammaproteobacteria bacterium]
MKAKANGDHPCVAGDIQTSATMAAIESVLLDLAVSNDARPSPETSCKKGNDFLPNRALGHAHVDVADLLVLLPTDNAVSACPQAPR